MTQKKKLLLLIVAALFCWGGFFLYQQWECYLGRASNRVFSEALSRIGY